MTDREKVIRSLNNTLRHCHNLYNHVTNEEQIWLAEINQGAKDALAMLKDQSDWISVKDGLPKKNGEYIVISESPICKRMLFAKFAKDLQKIDRNAFSGKTRSGWYDYDCDWGYFEFDYVTYWMPRPEPPKGENK